MPNSTLRPLARFKYQSVTAALLISALFAGNKAQADDYEFYVASTSLTGFATTLQDYVFDSAAGTATLTGTYATGAFGANSSGTGNGGALQLSGDGKSLSYAGFVTAGSTSNEVLFNLATKAVDKITTLTGTNVRSSWTQDGSYFYVAGGTTSTTPAYVVHGASTGTTIMASAFSSSNNIIENNGVLYATRNSNGSTGVYYASASTPITSATTFTPLTGTGLLHGGSPTTTGFTYNGIGFMGNSTMFLADNVANTITVYNDPTVGTTPFTNWNLTFTLPVTTPGNVPIQQLSIVQTDATDALVFFTSSVGNTTSSGSLSTFNEVSFNTSSGFGTINNLGSSSTAFFSGIAVVPEPATYALLGFGLGFFALIMVLRRKAGQGQG